MTPRERYRLGRSFDPWFREFWALITDLMVVSSTFHDVVSRLVRSAFGIPLPLVQDGINERLIFVRLLNWKTHTDYALYTSLVHQVYNKLRSLFYFGSAVLCGAFQAPPASWDPLMKAYGNYSIVLKHRLECWPPMVDPLDMAGVYGALHMHLCLCYKQNLQIFLAEDLVHAVGQISEGG